jgi:hypothetical protein
MTGTRIEVKKGKLELCQVKGIENRMEFPLLSEELRHICEDISSGSGKTTSYGNITIRDLTTWPGRSIELLIDNVRVFETGHFLLSGKITYSRFKEDAITLKLLNRLSELRELVRDGKRQRAR